MIDLTTRRDPGSPRTLKIIGLGGAGANALDRMALDGVNAAHLIAANTEAQALNASVAGEKIQLGREATRGLGSGGDPEVGRAAALEAAGEVVRALEGADGVFLVAGLGGGTGSGAAAVIAEQARRAGALVIAFVTLPFGFEGKRRREQAAEALAALAPWADAVVCFENDRMGEGVSPSAGIAQAFAAADQTISRSVQAIAALLARKGLVHLGYDDLKAVLRGSSPRCLFGYGEGEGSNRPFDALAQALRSPLMDKGRMLRDCETVLVQVSGGPDLTLNEVQLLMEEFNRHLSGRARLLFGAAVDPRLEGRLTVTILSALEGAPAPAVEAAAAPRVEAVVAPRAEVAAMPAVPEPEAVEPPASEPQAEAEPEAVATGEGEPEEAFAAEPEPPAPAAVEPSNLPPARVHAAQTTLFGLEEEEPPVAPLPEPEAPAPRLTRPVPGRTLKSTPKPIPSARPAEPEPPAAPEPVEVVEAAIPEPDPPAPSREEEPPPAARRAPEAPAVSPLAEAPASAAPAPGRTPQQETLRFEPVTRGRFEKSEPTIVDGQDLDVPTFLRRNIRVRP